MNLNIQNINHPKELRLLDRDKLQSLADYLRQEILETLSKTPGHLGGNLGVIELTVALHYFFDTPTDLLVWDVGHQSYAHKLLTGRKKLFNTLRQENGISGFTTREESIFDVFGAGHSSTSISAIMGMAVADKINNINRKYIAVIGDASIASGMSMEALNHLGDTNLDILIILNDNNISIDESVGALKTHFNSITKENSLFTDLGLNFLGTVDGHNITDLLTAFEKANKIIGPKVLHVKTIKGKGYKKAEQDKITWHSPGVYNLETGEIAKKDNPKTFQDVFGETMLQLMEENHKIVIISPAMLSGSNLKNCAAKFKNRVIDVGIAEQHAVTFSAGLSTQNTIPFCSIYSTFLQRAYDQVIHDVALQNLPVIFCIDRAGVVGSDGATHHGYFDISFLNSIPNIIVSSPSNETDFKNLLYTAQFTNQPFAIRYPKQEIERSDLSNFSYKKLNIGKASIKINGNKIAILSTGSLTSVIKEVIIDNQLTEHFCLIDFPFIKPLDYNLLQDISTKFPTIITYEDGVVNGGFGASVLQFFNNINYKGSIKINGYPDNFIPHASVNQLHKNLKLDKDSILKTLVMYI